MAERTESKVTPGSQTFVARPRRADGVGNALRAAFRDSYRPLPSDMQALLKKLG